MEDGVPEGPSCELLVLSTLCTTFLGVGPSVLDLTGSGAIGPQRGQEPFILPKTVTSQVKNGAI